MKRVLSVCECYGEGDTPLSRRKPIAMSFDRSQWTAVITGAIALLLGVGYLILVQLLDARGEMLPAPMSKLYLGWDACSHWIFSGGSSGWIL